MYILDEPSIGLHPRDTEKLISVLINLNKLGNTLIVVEHDEDIIRQADEVVDLGPEAGMNGGHIVFQGNHKELIKAGTLTSDYMTGVKSIPVPTIRRKWRNYISIVDAYENNLKHVSVKIPLQTLTCITGVSGSGKSTLIKDVLFKSLFHKINNHTWGSGKYENIEGNIASISQIELIDQNPIGKSSRSNPVTYLKAYDEIRALYSSLPEAKRRGVSPSDFSFNVDGGRCDTCKGEGEITVEMQFMADIRLTCDECQGKRFKDEIQELTFMQKSISDILEMTIDEAMEFFGNAEIMKNRCQKIHEKLEPLREVGLGYVKLGQSSSTLSGGEAQRVKLAFFLSKKSQNQSILFLFDEPSTGLHFHDINKLLISLNALVARGHSVIVIEHHLDIIKAADWIIDIGPEGGDAGGNIVFEGVPEDILNCKESYTGKYLKSKLIRLK
jgi:excinuclease ABC subunit A